MKKKNADHEAILEKTKTVFKEAMDYTIHRNYVTGSALSLVPFLKPIVRLFELYAYKARKHLSVQSNNTYRNFEEVAR